METRICKVCRIEKPLNLDHFKFKNGTEIFRRYCTGCKNNKWDIKNPDKVKIIKARWEQSEKGKARKKQYRETHQEEFKGWRSKCYEKNKERYNNSSRQWIIDNPERRKEIVNKYSSNNRETLRTKSRERYDPMKSYAGHIKRRYNITLEEYEQLLIIQNNKCKICKTEFSQTSRKKIHVDHSHITSKVRGLLCMNCNNGLGKFKDDSVLLKTALEYLESEK